MTAGTLSPFQIPASLHAIDSFAGAFQVDAGRVGKRVYGHPGGITVRERYILAEKREAHLKQSREASIKQREEQRKLRGELVRVEKTARRLVLHASRPCGRTEGQERTTHSIVASIKSAGTKRSADLSLRRDDAEVSRDITAHVGKVRGVLEQMDHTFEMARARSELRAAINGLRQNSAATTPASQREEQPRGLGWASATGEAGDVGKETVPPLRRCRDDDDAGVESPRERHLRRKAATCLQRYARGRPRRRAFRDLVWPALHISGAGEEKSKNKASERSRFGDEGRRAMLLARFRITRAAYERLKAVNLPVPTDLPGGGETDEHRCCETGPGSEPPSRDDVAATSWSTDAAGPVAKISSLNNPAVAADGEVAQRATAGGGGGERQHRERGAAPNADVVGTTTTPSAERTGKTTAPSAWQGGKQCSSFCGDGAGGGSTCATRVSKAAASARRELRIVLWALRDAAAHVVQEETRRYARRRRGRSEVGGLCQGTRKTTNRDTPEEIGGSQSFTGDNDGGFGGRYPPPSADGLPWVIAARLPTAVTRTTTATSSSRRAATARTGTARTTTTTSSTGVGTLWGSSSGGGGGGSGGSCSKQSHSSVSARSSLTANSAASPRWCFPHEPDKPDDDDFFPPGPGGASEEEWAAGMRQKTVKEGGTGAGPANKAAVRWPLLPAEERKKRQNEAHMRRNRSRQRHVERGLVNLECQGRFVLPEITRMQRLFRARRARRVLEQGLAMREAHQSDWKAEEAREREERAARWKYSMSRLRVARPPDSSKQPDGLAGVVGRAAAAAAAGDGVGSAEDECVPGKGFSWDLTGKDAPYASAKWSLAVAYDVASWRGGLRQRYYFGRLKAFFAHRRGRKMALRALVELRMVKRFQAWAALLAEEKHSLAGGIKARAPPEVVGAHVRFLSRTGTWSRLLLDLNEILERAVRERQQAVGLLSERLLSGGTPGHAPSAVLGTPTTASSSPGTQAPASAASRSAACSQRLGGASRRKSGGLLPGTPSANVWAAGSLQFPQGGSPGSPAGGGVWGGKTTGSRHGSSRARSAAAAAASGRVARLREVVDERTLRCLHPWMVSLLAKSGIQFVPSVPQKDRVGFRVDDTKKVEMKAEMQLTRRYWRLLGGVADAVSYVGAAKVEATTLAAEAGEWNLLLGLAHHLTSTGLLDPPCMLPKLPRSNGAQKPPGSDRTFGSNINLLGVVTKHITVFLAPARRLRERAEKAQERTAAVDSSVPGGSGPPSRTAKGRELLASPDKIDDARGGESAALRWNSAERDLCESCWATRTGASAAGGSQCQRCGQTHRRGFSQDLPKRTLEDDAGPVPWQRFSQVNEPLGLFVVHAAYACVLHPGCGNGESLPGGGLSWWSGGNPEEMWWRAVCGGKEATRHLRSNGIDTIGKLYAYVRGSAGTASAPPLFGSNGRVSLSKKTRGRTKKLGRLVKDDDIALKMSNLLFRLMSAFEELRAQHRWPTVSKAAVHHAMRELHLPSTTFSAAASRAGLVGSEGLDGLSGSIS